MVNYDLAPPFGIICLELVQVIFKQIQVRTVG